MPINLSNKPVLAAPTDSILVLPSRQRQFFDPKALTDLTASIREMGQASPGLCRPSTPTDETDRSWVLIYGERRLRACAELGISFRFLSAENLTPYELEYTEYTENAHRADLAPFEYASAVKRLHDLEMKHNAKTPWARGSAWSGSSSHTLDDTASIFGISRRHVSRLLEVAEYGAFSEDIQKSKTLAEAVTTLDRLKKIANRQIDNAELKAAATATAVASTLGNGHNAPSGGEPAFSENDEGPEIEIGEAPPRRDPTQYLWMGDMVNVLPEVQTVFDVVIWDPPWDVGFEENRLVSAKGHERYKAYADSGMMSNFIVWLDTLWQYMADDSHLYLFFGIVHHQRIYDMLEEVGFVTNRIPYIWSKINSRSTRNAEIWPGVSYEPVAYGRKGRKEIVGPVRGNIIETPMLSSKAKDIHPSAKHPKVYLELLSRSAAPGDKVLDPMCGSGMSAAAFEFYREREYVIDWAAIEMDSDYFLLARHNVESKAQGILEDLERVPSAEEVEGVTLEDFKKESPGTAEWKALWAKAGEALQKEVLEWRKTQE